MSDFEGFYQNARAKGILIDTNLLVLLIVRFELEHLRVPIAAPIPTRTHPARA